jgi:peroxiredoxin
MPKPQRGDLAPDVRVFDGSGSEQMLSTQWSKQPAVAVFLRHYGCTFCQEHALQLRADHTKFKKAGVKVALIGLGTPERAAWFCQDKELNGFACLTDPARRAHRAYGLGRGSLRQVLGPQVYLQWAKAAMLPEVKTRFGHEDIFQMPGTFVIDTDGVLRFVHRNRDVADNPPNQEIFDALKEL